MKTAKYWAKKLFDLGYGGASQPEGTFATNIKRIQEDAILQATKVISEELSLMATGLKDLVKEETERLGDD